MHSIRVHCSARVDTAELFWYTAVHRFTNRVQGKAEAKYASASSGQQRRPGSQSAEKETPARRRVQGNEIEAALREAVRTQGSRKGRGDPQSTKARPKESAPRRPALNSERRPTRMNCSRFFKRSAGAFSKRLKPRRCWPCHVGNAGPPTPQIEKQHRAQVNRKHLRNLQIWHVSRYACMTASCLSSSSENLWRTRRCIGRNFSIGCRRRKRLTPNKM